MKTIRQPIEVQMKVQWLLLALILTLSACAARVKDQVIRDAAAGQCEQAVAAFEKTATKEMVWQKTKQIGGATASGAATGVVAVTETAIYILPGVAVGVIVCSPVIALEVAARGHGHASARCITVLGLTSLATFAGNEDNWIANRIWKSTESWRLESYDELSRMLRGIARCYAGRNTPEALQTAEKQVKSIRQSLWDSLSADEKKQVDLLLNHIRTRMNPVKEEQVEP